MILPGSELYLDDTLPGPERWYCRLFGIPIVGLRIRLRWLSDLLPETAQSILDAGCGRGVISRMLARRYPQAKVDAVDQNAEVQAANARLTERSGIANCDFVVNDLASFQAEDCYDLLVSVDNLEHIEDDRALLRSFFRMLQERGVLVVHVPHYYRRWPLFKWTANFSVPGHVRCGYHLPELVERVRAAGFVVDKLGFSYGWMENMANNLSYLITAAEERNKLLYALTFPFLNAMAWLGHAGRPRMGAGVWLVAHKPSIGVAERLRGRTVVAL